MDYTRMSDEELMIEHARIMYQAIENQECTAADEAAISAIEAEMERRNS